MRKLLLLRGLPGSGKTTFVSQQGLQPYTLSADGIRMTYGSPVLQVGGTLRVPAEFDRTVWQQLLQLMEMRMERGELIVIDATHTHPRSFSNYQQAVNKHRYQVACIDFSTVPLDVCQQRNLQREEYKIVPPLEMERMHANMQRTRLPKWISPVAPEDLDAFLATPPKDVSEYKAVHHLGDIQGCFDPLDEYFKTYGMNEDELYIFVGDYLDRGTQNAAVMQWLFDNYHRPNFIFIEGNHEAHLRAWARGTKARSRQFNQATAVELEAADIAPKKVYGFLYKLREMYFYAYGDKKVLVTHGGLSTLPEKLAYINSRQLIRGVGLYEEADSSDAAFADTAPEDAYQVHGHRNRFSSPTKVNEKCFNLEGKIEFGGDLRVVVLDKNGFHERLVKSNIDAIDTIIESVGDAPKAVADVASLVARLRASSDIYEKPQPDSNISSFNFKRDVFYTKSWDMFNVHARGLFINTATNAIVARSYEKFFNVGERPETQPDALARTLRFPVRAWVKENGYLGLIGYDPESDELVFASKSSLTSSFAGWLRQQFDTLAPIDSKTRNDVIDYIKSDGGKTLIFEVIEPVSDPHIIAYPSRELVLLDIAANSVEFKPVSRSERSKVADLLGVRTKQAAQVINDVEALHAWLKSTQTFDYRYEQQNIEGFVLEDSTGFMVKVKLPWYGFWRQMRTQLERRQAGKKTQLPSLSIHHELAESFLNYLNDLSEEALQAADIITLRNDFLGRKSADLH